MVLAVHPKIKTQIDPLATTLPPESGEVAAQEFAPGRVLADKYVIEHVIGEGGLGAVLKARHRQLDQHVAIKYLKPVAAARTDVVERFMREAKLAARIKNEHAVKVHDVDESPGGVPYMVMEYLEGRDLERAVAESPLPVTVAIDYVMQAIEAIAEAHAAGIVHRDIKPANLFLASRPGSASIVKVLDFGISKLTSGDPAGKRVTRIDERVGTPAYMSPEQLDARAEVDARSDVWSLGVVLYELVTGRLPFEGSDLPQICVAILTKPPVPLLTVNGEAPPELETLIERCLQKDRDSRYQNVAELAQDLVQIWEGDSPSRVKHIAALIAEAAGQKIEFPPAAKIDETHPDAWLEKAARADEDQVVAVFTDASGAKVDELEFFSIDEAYDYASTLAPDAVRCEVYDQFAGVRGKLRVTYVRKREADHWVPLIP
jgi:serine/threonine-protein kinase